MKFRRDESGNQKRRKWKSEETKMKFRRDESGNQKRPK
jgi:hypothetical protein